GSDSAAAGRCFSFSTFFSTDAKSVTSGSSLAGVSAAGFRASGFFSATFFSGGFGFVTGTGNGLVLAGSGSGAGFGSGTGSDGAGTATGSGFGAGSGGVGGAGGAGGGLICACRSCGSDFATSGRVAGGVFSVAGCGFFSCLGGVVTSPISTIRTGIGRWTSAGSKSDGRPKT